MPNTIYKEFRGTDQLVYAKVLQDDETAFVTGPVKRLAGMSSITRTREQSSDNHYYDNGARLTVLGEGADTVTIGTDAIALSVLAEITGQTYDDQVGAMYGGPTETAYFALGYRIGLIGSTGPSYRYVWKLKGTFQVPEESSSTENAGTDAAGQSLIYTSIRTTHKFTRTGKDSKDTVADEGATNADLSTWFDSVQTPDTINGGVTIDSRLQAVTSEGISWYPESGGFNVDGPYAAGTYAWTSITAPNAWTITFTIATGATAEYIWANHEGIHTGTVTGQTSFTIESGAEGSPSGFRITIHGMANGVATTSVYTIEAD